MASNRLAAYHPADQARLQALLDGPISCFTLGHFLGSTQPDASVNGYNLLNHFGVVPKSNTRVVCGTCAPVVVRLAPVIENRGPGFRWRCPVCQSRFSPLQNTFLENVRGADKGYDAIVKIAYFWLTSRPQVEAAAEIPCALDKVKAWYSYLRAVAHIIASHDYVQVGGERDVVEVDETYLFKRKYNRERPVGHGHVVDVWALGGISRTTHKVFGCVVGQGDCGTLEALVRHVDTASYICSDQWAACNQLQQTFAGHGSVNHSQSFVNPPRSIDPLWEPVDRFTAECYDAHFHGPPPRENVRPFRIHTQAIESTWRGLKRTLKSQRRVEDVVHYIGEWMYRHNILRPIGSVGDQMARLLHDVKRAYPGVGPNAKMAEDIEQCNCIECNYANV